MGGDISEGYGYRDLGCVGDGGRGVVVKAVLIKASSRLFIYIPEDEASMVSPGACSDIRVAGL